MKALICVSSVAIDLNLAAAVLLCSNVTNEAGGGLPNSDQPLLLSPVAIMDLQLVVYQKLRGFLLLEWVIEYHKVGY